MPDASPQPDSAAAQQQVHRVPAYAAWFRHDRLHQLEVKGLPEYFQSNSPTKNPRVRLYGKGLPPPQVHASHWLPLQRFGEEGSARKNYNGCAWLFLKYVT